MTKGYEFNECRIKFKISSKLRDIFFKFFCLMRASHIYWQLRRCKSHLLKFPAIFRNCQKIELSFAYSSVQTETEQYQIRKFAVNIFLESDVRWKFWCTSIFYFQSCSSFPASVCVQASFTTKSNTALMSGEKYIDNFNQCL